MIMAIAGNEPFVAILMVECSMIWRRPRVHHWAGLLIYFGTKRESSAHLRSMAVVV